MSHPNTLASIIAGGIATLTVYLLNKYAGTHLNTADGTGIATGVIAAILFVGRRGIKGTLQGIWHGQTAPAPPTTLQPPPVPPPG